MLERFLDHLRAVDPRNQGDLDTGEFVVWGADQRHAVVHLDPSELERAVSERALQANGLWPDAPPELVGFRLLSIHLIEEIDSGPPPASKLRLRNGEIVTDGEER
ncbi:hypothetical protein ROT00_18200 [Agromyces mediolanus]|uniref:hypothetical protein n=1 Tax=Agromyces mediolanus TaxID=41986 RepID=UPI0038361BB2